MGVAVPVVVPARVALLRCRDAAFGGGVADQCLGSKVAVANAPIKSMSHYIMHEGIAYALKTR